MHGNDLHILIAIDDHFYFLRSVKQVRFIFHC